MLKFPNKIKPDLQTYFPLLLILIVLSITFLWFKDGFPLARAEQGPLFYSPLRTLNLHQFSWVEAVIPGLSSIFSPVILPQFTVFKILESGGIAPFLLQALLYSFYLGSAALGVYFLVNLIWEKERKFLGFLAALFYLFNPFSLYVWVRGLLSGQAFFAFLPVGLTFYVLALKKKSWFYLVIFALFSLLYSPIGLHPAFAIAFPLTIVLFSLVLLIFKFEALNRLKVIQFMIGALILWGLVNAFWVLPQIVEFQSRVFSITLLEQANLSQTALDLAARFQLSDFIPLWYYNLHAWLGSYFQSPIIKVLSFLLPILALIGLISLRKTKLFYLFGLLTILAFFLMKGAKEPLGFIFLFVLEKIPGAGAFQNSFEKLGYFYLLPLSILAALGVRRLFDYLQKIKTRFFRVSFNLVLLILILAYLFLVPLPLWTGSVFSSKDNNYSFEPPAAYDQVNEITKNTTGSRLIHLPLNNDAGTTLNWRFTYDGQDPARHLFDSPSLSQITGWRRSDQILYALGNHFFEIPPWKLAAFYSTNYFLLHYDVDWQRRNVSDPKKIEQFLVANAEGLEPELKNFPLSLRKIKPKFQASLVRPIAKMRTVKSLEELISQFKTADFDPKVEGIILEEDLKTYPILQNQALNNLKGEDLPQVHFERLNPTLLKVKVRKATSPFILLFAENYHPSWQATLNGKILTDHFPLNYFQNAWYLDQKGDFDLEIKFYPQKYLTWGKLISLVFSIGIFLSIIIFWIIRRQSTKGLFES